MAGHEYDFWPIVQRSPWLGGHSEYSPLNEGFPYWFNGLVPLAYGLDDPRLKAQINDAMDYVLSHQHANGWLGPESNHDSSTTWARFPFMLGLMQVVQADLSHASRIIPAMHNFVKLMHSLLLDGKFQREVWSPARYADMIICLQWLLETYPENNQKLLLETMQRLKGNGLDWHGYYTEENYLFQDLDTITDTSSVFPYTHAVNVAQGLKAGAVDYRFTRNSTLLESCRNGVNWTFEYHGAASGTILGDERESGLSPTRGSELCTAVEAMYSLSYLYQMLGDNAFADRCELAAFNALPVMLTPDHWAHQYIAQPNQPWSRKVQSSGLFWNVGDWGQMYGLSPNYPCCTVNHPQGNPKLLSASFVRVGPNGLGHALLIPANVSAFLGNGTFVAATCSTHYPFSGLLIYAIYSNSSFIFHIRIPSWSQPSRTLISVNGVSQPLPSPDSHSGMIAIPLTTGNNGITLTLSSEIRIVPRANDTVAIYHRALLYALDVGQNIHILPPSMAITRQPNPHHDSHSHSLPPKVLTTFNSPIPPQAHDYIINNTLPWSIAIDPHTAIFHASSTSNSSNYNSCLSSAFQPQANPIWEYHAPESYITVLGCEIHWPVDHGVPARVPLVGRRNCTGRVREVVLRPYGSLRVHMAELPVVRFNETVRWGSGRRGV
ncbi:hypothetical protein MMC30_008055 [Trapelia coarctata]|nr:hypothetical protein [Trapelia coarctata]